MRDLLRIRGRKVTCRCRKRHEGSIWIVISSNAFAFYGKIHTDIDKIFEINKKYGTIVTAKERQGGQIHDYQY